MNDKNKYILPIIIIYIGIFGAFLLIKNNKSNVNYDNQLSFTQSSNDLNVQNDNIDDPIEIYVHISGEVNYPGLIKLDKGQRLFQAIEIAGGMTELADVDQINLSVVLNDEDKVYIPKKGENAVFLTTNAEPLININTCTKEDLMSLTGIGEKTADSILEHRSKNRFEKIEDLKKIKGIGDQKFESIKDRITI